METYKNFLSLDIRVGKILSATKRTDLRSPAIQMTIDFGVEIGILMTSAQIVDLYDAEHLIGKLIVALVNIPPRQISNIVSECLVLGFNTDKGVVLIEPDQNLELGSKLA